MPFPQVRHLGVPEEPTGRLLAPQVARRNLKVDTETEIDFELDSVRKVGDHTIEFECAQSTPSINLMEKGDLCIFAQRLHDWARAHTDSVTWQQSVAVITSHLRHRNWRAASWRTLDLQAHILTFTQRAYSVFEISHGPPFLEETFNVSRPGLYDEAGTFNVKAAQTIFASELGGKSQHSRRPF